MRQLVSGQAGPIELTYLLNHTLICGPANEHSWRVTPDTITSPYIFCFDGGWDLAAKRTLVRPKQYPKRPSTAGTHCVRLPLAAVRQSSPASRQPFSPGPVSQLLNFARRLGELGSEASLATGPHRPSDDGHGLRPRFLDHDGREARQAIHHRR